MYEEKTHFGKLLLKQSETILTRWTLTFDPVTPKSEWTEFEEGRSRRSRVIDRKQKKVTDGRTD